MICLISLCTDNREGYVFCTADCSNGKTRLMFYIQDTAKGSTKRLKKPKQVKKKLGTPRNICGVKICVSCMSNFGLDCHIPRCPLHYSEADSEEPHFFIKDQTLKMHADSEYKKIAKYLNESKDQGRQKKQYFNGTFEYCDAILEAGRPATTHRQANDHHQPRHHQSSELRHHHHWLHQESGDQPCDQNPG